MSSLPTGAGPAGTPHRHIQALAAACAALLAVSVAMAEATPADLRLRYGMAVFAGFLPTAFLVLTLAPGDRAACRFGAANWATLARGVLAAVAAGLVAVPEALSGSPALAWLPFGLLTAGVALDVADGRLARRHRTTSAFGARFDLETDAWTTLVMAALAVRLDAVPAWALAIGLPRYLFLAAGCVRPALAAALPPSRRRRLVGGAGVLALAFILSPPASPDTAMAVAAAVVAALAWSFGRDVTLLLRGATRRPPRPVRLPGEPPGPSGRAAPGDG